jgi:neuroligin
VYVFLHGESYEWNSGNPYDGSVLAAYNSAVVITINYRLGILGFFKAGVESTGNLGLLDQTAALLWVQENIEQFGGNANSVTIIGHGTGAHMATLLMLSPVVQKGKNIICKRFPIEVTFITY